MNTVIDPVRLSGLKQAAFVMNCVTTGQRMDEITMALRGDEQLVKMWISFLRHNHWITPAGRGWSVTPKGAMWGKNIAVPARLTT